MASRFFSKTPHFSVTSMQINDKNLNRNESYNHDSLQNFKVDQLLQLIQLNDKNFLNFD
jgi:hypothetical protein